MYLLQLRLCLEASTLFESVKPKHVDRIADYEATVDTGDGSCYSTHIVNVFTPFAAIAAGTFVSTVSVLGWVWSMLSAFLSITRSRFVRCAVCAQRK